MNGIEFLISEVKKEKELVKSSFLMFLASGIPAITSFLMNLILAKIFVPESFGDFKTTTYLITLFTSLITFGIPTTLVKYIAQFKVKNKDKINYMIRWFIKIRILSFFTLTLLILIFLKPITLYFLHDPSLDILVIAGISIIIANIFSILIPMVQGYENFKVYLLSRIINSVGYITLPVSLGYFFGVPYAIVGLAIANLLGYVPCLKFIIKKGVFEKRNGKFDIKEIFTKFSLPMYIFKMPTFFGNAIVPLLSLFFTRELIGQYSFSFIFYYAGLVIPTSLGSVILPMNSRLLSLKNEKKIKNTMLKVFSVYTIIVIFGIISVLSLGRFILATIAPEYLPGLIFFKVLVSFGLLSGYIVIYNSHLIAKERIKEVAILTLIQNLSLFLISFLLLKMA